MNTENIWILNEIANLERKDCTFQSNGLEAAAQSCLSLNPHKYAGLEVWNEDILIL